MIKIYKDTPIMGYPQKTRAYTSDVLDKIRAEIIEDIEKYNDIYDDTCHGLRMALDIIDKYKAESEEE